MAIEEMLMNEFAREFDFASLAAWMQEGRGTIGQLLDRHQLCRKQIPQGVDHTRPHRSRGYGARHRGSESR